MEKKTSNNASLTMFTMLVALVSQNLVIVPVIANTQAGSSPSDLSTELCSHSPPSHHSGGGCGSSGTPSSGSSPSHGHGHSHHGHGHGHGSSSPPSGSGSYNPTPSPPSGGGSYSPTPSTPTPSPPSDGGGSSDPTPSTPPNCDPTPSPGGDGSYSPTPSTPTPSPPSDGGGSYDPTPSTPTPSPPSGSGSYTPTPSTPTPSPPADGGGSSDPTPSPGGDGSYNPTPSSPPSGGSYDPTPSPPTDGSYTPTPSTPPASDCPPSDPTSPTTPSDPTPSTPSNPPSGDGGYYNSPPQDPTSPTTPSTPTTPSNPPSGGYDSPPSDPIRDYAPAVREQMSNGYLLIAASGGLNQQRTGITDAVVVARILNATLVVPELDHHSFWKDDSDFINIFDVDWFISYLAKDVTIVKRVPDKVMRSMEKPPYTMRVPRKSEPDYYLDQVLPILLRRQVVQLTKFDFRLANHLDDELQKLRCRVNFHALRFTKPIQELGQTIVTRMQKMAHRFIAVHLRFEPDMLAFSGCYFGGGEKERNELGEIRKRWTTLPDLSPDGERKRGKCPLTPHEVGLMLRALGFTNDTYLYVASGEIYGGDETMQPLKDLFPNIYTKEMLADEELKPFLPFSSRLAAVDYIVCDESDVFVTNNNGNMAKILAGRRRYMGHKRTIRPNAKKLSTLFAGRHQMDWHTFARKVKACQRGFMGEPDEMRPGRDDHHEFPSSCVCERPYVDEKLGTKIDT